MKIRKARNKALNDMAKVIENLYGPRCDRFEATCSGCATWAVFDMIEKMTETSFLDLDEKMKK